MKLLARLITARAMARDRRSETSRTVILNAACACLGLTLACVSASDAADAPGGQSGRRQAIVIGVEKYQKAPRLRYASNDVRQLAMTLRERGDYQVLEIINSAREDNSLSESRAVEAKVKECLVRLGPQDDVLVYFSCHGFRDSDGKLYLAQIDCDPANPAPGGIPVAWLREQLAACKAKFKLLLIDACHGGAEKGDEAGSGVAARDLGTPFGDLASVVTLASSQGDEKSLVWYEKRQSLFTYWVNQGLKGHADQNGDGRVTIDELYEYVFENVTDVAERYFGRKQTPVRIVRSGTPGVPVVVSLNPHTLKGMLDDMAEQLATAMQLRGLKKVGIPEFSVDAGTREVLGGQFGVLGRYCAAELEGSLTRRSGDKFNVVQHDALREALQTKGLAVKDLHTNAVRDLSVREEKLPVLAVGTLRTRNGRVITAQCRLVGLKDQETLGMAGGSADLNESEWGMLGHSANAPLPAPPTVDRPAPPDSIIRLDHEAQGGHPLLDRNFPYRVQVMVGNQEREGVFRGNDMFVPLRKAEVYWLRIESRDPGVVLLRLLVDGRSTLPEKVRTKNVTVEPTETPTNERDVELPAQRVNLAEARYWRLDPNGVFGIRGFFSRLGDDGKFNEFTVTDAPNSLSERESFSDQLGIITAAFYTPKGGSRGLMTEPGKEQRQKLRMYKDMEVGNLLAVINIHYVEPEALQRASDDKPPPAR
jgi:hypothetical protein